MRNFLKCDITLKDKTRIIELIESMYALFDETHNLANSYLTGELNISIFEKKCKILGALLDRKDNYNLEKKLKALRFSHGLRENNYFSPFLNILRGIHEEQSSTDGIFQLFFTKLENYLDSIKEKPLNKYELIFPINLNFKAGYPIKFLRKKDDLDINLLPYPNYMRYLEKIDRYIEDKYGTLRKYVKGYKQVEYELLQRSDNRDNSYFIVNIFARNIGYAAKRSNNAILANAGLYSFLKYYKIGVSFFGGDYLEKSIGNIKIPVIFVFLNEEVETIFFYSYKLYRSEKIESIGFNELNSITNFFKAIHEFQSQKLKSLVINAFTKFYDALNISEYSISFLTFWNIIEELLLNNASTPLAEIVRRLKSIYPESENNRDIDEQIDLLYKKRNLFVHESINKITGSDRDDIKRFTEDVIDFFIDMSNYCKNIGMLKFLLENLRKDINSLDQESEVLEFLKKIKSSD